MTNTLSFDEKMKNFENEICHLTQTLKNHFNQVGSFFTEEEKKALSYKPTPLEEICPTIPPILDSRHMLEDISQKLFSIYQNTYTAAISEEFFYEKCNIYHTLETTILLLNILQDNIQKYYISHDMSPILFSLGVVIGNISHITIIYPEVKDFPQTIFNYYTNLLD